MLFPALFTMFIAILIFNQRRQVSRLPPGPTPLPLLGNLLQLGYYIILHRGIVSVLQDWKKKYGPVFTVWLGPIPTVHIASLDLAQETMLKNGSLYADRWVPLVMGYVREERGILATNGEMWQEQRRFSLHTLRNFGLGRNVMEERIMEEFEMRSADIDRQQKCQENVQATHFFELLVGSIINRMLFSERFTEENQQEFFRLKKKLDNMLESITVFDMCAKKWFFDFPILEKRYQKFAKPMEDVKAFIAKQVRERSESIENGSHVIDGEGTDYADAYLLKIKQEKGHDSKFDERTLVVNLLDLWIAGQETTATTLQWGAIFFLNHPEVQNKVREEVASITNNERSLSLSDKTKTPSLNATIMEVQRLASILNLNLWRQLSESQLVGGHPVEKGTIIAMQMSLIMSDPTKFENPEQFDPTRFLKKEGLEQNILPFGLGKRACLGESLARAELYLIIGNLLHRYELIPVGSVPSMKSVSPFGIMNRPPSYEMIMKKVVH